jgi:hypothetical protein
MLGTKKTCLNGQNEAMLGTKKTCLNAPTHSIKMSKTPIHSKRSLSESLSDSIGPYWTSLKFIKIQSQARMGATLNPFASPEARKSIE